MTVIHIRPPDDSVCKVALGAINSSLVGSSCSRGLGGSSSYCGSSASVGVTFFNSAKLIREFLIPTVLIR